MKATQALHEAGQSLWLDNITRTLLDEGTLAKYIAELSVTGLTSNPTIFEKAITGGDTYDEQVHSFHGSDMTDEQVFFEAAISDLQRAADLFGDIHTRTDNLDGFVSLEVSPELAYDTDATVAQAKELHAKVDRSNVFIKIPGTPEGLPAISAAVFRLSSGNAAGRVRSSSAPSTFEPAAATRPQNATGSSASSSRAFTSDVDQTIEIRLPGRGRYARMPSSRNH